MQPVVAGTPVGSRNWWDTTREWMSRAGPRPPTEPRIGLALGGGFARGIAHVGVLRVLERNHIPIHCIAGVSSGSIVASAFAAGSDSSEIELVARSMRFRDVAKWTLSRMGIAGSDPMIPFLKKLLKAGTFEEMRTPLAIVATDLATGKPVVFRDHGDVIAPIRASCSFPGLYMPLRYQNRYLVDGFVSMEVPTYPLRRMGANHIIAVNIPNPVAGTDPGNMLSVVDRCFQVMSARLEPEWRRYADVVITPDVADIGWDSFMSASKLIELGEKAALSALSSIRRWLPPSASAAAQSNGTLPVPGLATLQTTAN
jgi:NTE family protein